MNKKVALAVVMGLGAVAVVQADTQEDLQNLRIRTINIMDIMRDSQEGKKVAAELEQTRQQLTTDIKAAEEEYVREANLFQSKAAMLSAEAREKEQARLMSVRRDVESKAQKAEDTLKYSMQAASDRLMTKAQKIIDAYGKENNLDLIFDVSGRVVYSSEETDVTKTMVTTMNDEYVKESSAKA